MVVVGHQLLQFGEVNRGICLGSGCPGPGGPFQQLVVCRRGIGDIREIAQHVIAQVVCVQIFLGDGGNAVQSLPLLAVVALEAGAVELHHPCFGGDSQRRAHDDCSYHVQVGFWITGTDADLAHGDDVLVPEIGVDLGSGDSGGCGYLGVGNGVCCQVVAGDAGVVNGSVLPPCDRVENRQFSQFEVSAGVICGGGARAAVLECHYTGDVVGVAGDVTFYAGSGDRASYLRGWNIADDLGDGDISYHLCGCDVPRYLRAAHRLDVVVGDCVALPGAGDDVAGGIHCEGPGAAAGLGLPFAAHGQGRLRLGGADSYVAGVAVHHEGGTGGRFDMEKALWILGPNTDTAHRREQVVPLLGGGSAVPGHEQVLTAVVLHVPVAVFHPHAEDKPTGSRQGSQHHALFAADPVIGLRVSVLSRNVVIPGLRVPVFNRVVVHGKGQGTGGVVRPAELHRYGDGVGSRGGLSVGNRVDLGYVHDAGSAIPRRRPVVIKLGVNSELAVFLHLDGLGNVTFVDQVMLESDGALPGMHSVDLVGTVAVGLGEVIILHHPDHDTLDGQFVLGGDRTAHSASYQCFEHDARRQHRGVRCGHGNGRGIIDALVTRVHEAHLVTAHWYLTDHEPAVVAGETDVVGALDDDEGARMPTGKPV